MAKIIDFKTKTVLADLPYQSTKRTAVIEPPLSTIYINSNDLLWEINPMNFDRLKAAVQSTGKTLSDYVEHTERKIG